MYAQHGVDAGWVSERTWVPVTNHYLAHAYRA